MNNEEKITQEQYDFLVKRIQSYMKEGTNINIKINPDKRKILYSNNSINIDLINEEEVNMLRSKLEEKGIYKDENNRKEFSYEQENAKEDPLVTLNRIFNTKAKEDEKEARDKLLQEYIKNFEPTKQEISRIPQNHNKKKRNIKNRCSKIKNIKYKGNIKNRIKALIATALVVGGIVGGAYGINKHHEYIYEYAETATRVEGMTDAELKDYIENIIKEEISKATGVDTDKIDISKYSSGTNFQVTKVTAGEAEYKWVDDLRSPINIGNTLKSNGLRAVIDETRNSKNNRDELIKTLMKAKKFSDKKDLVVDGNKLKEVDSDKAHDDER